MALAVVMVGQHNVVQAKEEGCSASTSRSFTLSYGGAIFPVADSGPYTVNSDCTVSATYSDGTWNMVIIGDGKEIKAPSNWYAI